MRDEGFGMRLAASGVDATIYFVLRLMIRRRPPLDSGRFAAVTWTWLACDNGALENVSPPAVFLCCLLVGHFLAVTNESWVDDRFTAGDGFGIRHCAGGVARDRGAVRRAAALRLQLQPQWPLVQRSAGARASAAQVRPTAAQEPGANSEAFIERAATQSSFSGTAYRVRCPETAEVESRVWFSARLRQVRAEK